MKPPEISIILPVRDGARWIEQSVASLRHQSFDAFELLVIDDGSRDATPTLLADLLRQDARIQVIRQERSGLVAALNRGLSAARCPFVARIDADDRAHPLRLERQLAYLSNHPDVVLLGSWAHVIDADGRRIGSLTPATRAQELRATMVGANPFVHSSIMMRRDAALRAGGYRAALQGAEDDDLWLRMAEIGEPANLPDYLVDYRKTPPGTRVSGELRQAFSARLARLSARRRTADQTDPVARLAEPPDWREPAAESELYGEAAAIYRVLDLADPDTPGIPTDADVARFVDAASLLTHAERRLAARALVNQWRSPAGLKRHAVRKIARHLALRNPVILGRMLWSIAG